MNNSFKVLMLFFLQLGICSIAYSSDKSGFTLWQLPSQTPSQMNSYVILTDNGKVCVIDGGNAGDAPYLKGFLAALGNEVEAWFISHPHLDHIGALNEILKAPDDLKINTIYHSEMSKMYYDQHEIEHRDLTVKFYDNLRKYKGKVVNLTKAGSVIVMGDTKFKILGVKNEEIIVNPYNNQSMIIKVLDRKKSVLFLNDIGREGGDKLLNSPYRSELDCDYLQMAHHGQNGVRKDFYRTIHFSACLWPTPKWLHDNDAGKGYNTHTW